MVVRRRGTQRADKQVLLLVVRGRHMQKEEVQTQQRWSFRRQATLRRTSGGGKLGSAGVKLR